MGEVLKITKEGLYLGEKPFYLASGDMHYFRFFKGGWKRRLQLMKDFGLTAVQTYVPWDLHEPEEGEYHFEDNLDLVAFLELCQEVGLKVMFRPSPYMCSEWDWGGLPYWLANKDFCIRTCDPEYMACVRRFYERLAKEFIPYLSTNGGPIIAVAVENEYGSFTDDEEYIKQLGDLLIELGVDVPLFTANGHHPYKMIPGSRPEYWTGADFRSFIPEIRECCEAYQPDKPIYAGEFWGGRSQQWGGYYMRQTPEEVAQNYKYQLEQGVYSNFYMFCGGTNFGFMSGGLMRRYNDQSLDVPPHFVPFMTSYDVDAPVSEWGEPSEKYYQCKKVLQEFLKEKGFSSDAPEVVENTYKAQKVGNITLSPVGDLLDQRETLAEKIVTSAKQKTMEELGQAYGFILYRTHVKKYGARDVREVQIEGLHDRALIYVNGEYKGCYVRDRAYTPVRFEVPETGAELDILVENMGRICYGNAMLNDKKGITDYVKLEVVDAKGNVDPHNFTFKTGWTTYTLPLKDLSVLRADGNIKKNRPAFFEGTFKAVPGMDTFVNMKGWTKGNVWVNGFNLGRFWKVGPAETLYVPGELLQEENTIQVLELHVPKADYSVVLDDKASLDSLEKTVDICPENIS